MKTGESCPSCSENSEPTPALPWAADNCCRTAAPSHLFEYSLALLIFTLALAISCIFGLPAIILGNTSVFYRYWHCLPCLLFAVATWVMPGSLHEQAVLALRYAAVTLLAFSPFPTWALLSSGNGYLELCACICLLASIICLQTYCRCLCSLAQSIAELRLLQQVRKTQWLLLYFVLVPLCALYLAGAIILTARYGEPWQKIFHIWGYGRISMYVRVLLYWGLLQVSFLSLLTLLLTCRQLRKRLTDNTSGKPETPAPSQDG